MRKIIKRTLCLLMSLLMLSSSLLTVFAVDYPSGVTNEMCRESSLKTDKLIENAVPALSGKSLKKAVNDELFSSTTLSALLTGVYSSLSQSASVLSKIGIDISVNNLAVCLSTYPSVSKCLAKASDWESVDLANAKWNADDAQKFADAVGAIFSPFNDVLYMLLCGGTYRSGIIIIPGDYGYEKGLMSMLSALGCTYIENADTFRAQAYDNKNNMMSLITSSLLSMLDSLTSSPSQKLCQTLPVLADYIKNGGLEASVNALLRPLTIHIGDYFQLFTGSQMLSFLMFIQEPGKYTLKFSENITTVMNDMLESSDVSLPQIDLDALISCENDIGGAYRLILTWLIDAAKLNSDKITELIPQDEDTKQITDIALSLLTKDTDELFKMAVDLFTAKQGKTLEYQWTSHAYNKTYAEYTENLGEAEMERVLDGIDETISEFIVEMSGGEPLTDTVKNLVYSNKLVTQIAKGIYGMLSGEETKTIAELLSLPTSPYQLSLYITDSSLGTAKRALASYSSWEKADNISWGFTDGNKKGFKKALTAVLRPLRPALEAFLANGTLEIFDSINIGGSNGYNTAVIPILEALGCSQKKIKTYDKYIKGKGTDSIITDILDPILDLVDRIAKRPIYTATQIIPNILFFVDNGSLMQCLENLMYPLTSLMSELSVDMKSLGFDLDEIKNTDLISKLTQSASSLVEGIDIGNPDIKKLMGMGELTQVSSKRTYNSQKVTAEYVKADQKAVLMTVLQYVASLLSKEENSDLLGSFMGGGESSGGMFDQYSAGIGDQMAEMTPQETLEWLYKLFFRERPVVETTQEEYVPTIIYVQQAKKKQSKLPIVIALMLLAALGAFAFVRRDSIESFFKRRKEEKMLKSKTGK